MKPYSYFSWTSIGWSNPIKGDPRFWGAGGSLLELFHNLYEPGVVAFEQRQHRAAKEQIGPVRATTVCTVATAIIQRDYNYATVVWNADAMRSADRRAERGSK